MTSADALAMGDAVTSEAAPSTSAGELAVTALMLLPGALIVYMGFFDGGYFPGAPAVAAIVLAQILLVRIMLARRPFEGLAPATLVAITALGCYALLTLVSASWSHSSSRALIAFDRVWMYLLVLVLLGSVRASTQNLRWLIRGLVIGISVVCLAGLISRVLPNLWPTAPAVSDDRLSYPLTYWNALGLLAALGIVLAFHLTCTLDERRLVQVLAAAVVPLLAATLYFTLSRGAIAAGAVGLVIYVLVARPDGLITGALATVPATAVLVLVAYHANLLNTADPTTPAAVAQGHHVAAVAGICTIACAVLRLLFAVGPDRHLRRALQRPWIDRRAGRAMVGGVLAVLVVGGLALGAPHGIASDWHRFLSGANTPTRANHLNERLTDPANDGRTELWRVALHSFSASPLHGYGAGAYQTLWYRNRPTTTVVVNAHSLYFQTMAELGLPGIALLVILVGAVLIGLAIRARSPRRALYGALFAASVVWVLHAGVDWDWEMPVVTLGFFAVAGAALSPRSGLRAGWVPAPGSRVVLALLCLVSLVVPVLIIGSQGQLNNAENALYASNDCSTAGSAALSSIGWLDVRPEPFEILGFCDVARDEPRLGVLAMERAVHVDPRSWETYYTLAIAQAAAGIDPRPAAERALEMNPLDPLTRQEVREFQTSSPTEWVNRSPVVRASALASSELSIVPS